MALKRAQRSARRGEILGGGSVFSRPTAAASDTHLNGGGYWNAVLHKCDHHEAPQLLVAPEADHVARRKIAEQWIARLKPELRLDRIAFEKLHHETAHHGDFGQTIQDFARDLPVPSNRGQRDASKVRNLAPIEIYEIGNGLRLKRLIRPKAQVVPICWQRVSPFLEHSHHLIPEIVDALRLTETSRPHTRYALARRYAASREMGNPSYV